jgi:hypothetical protein
MKLTGIVFAAIAFTISAPAITNAQAPRPGFPITSAEGGPPAEPSQAHARTIHGVWRTVVTPRNCQTDAPFPPLAGLFTFNEGGSMSEYGIGPGSSPALRSPGHGCWKREHGWQDYSFAFTFYRYNASGVFLGSQRVTAALELAAGGDEFVSRSVIEVLDDHDTVIGGGCATAAGKRFD